LAAENFGWRIYERGAERMSAKTRGRSYGGGSKEAVDGDGETTASKKGKW
jgi:hypothetical protein